MPLRKDENYRGPHAVHVKSHKKLGKHRTVTEDAFEIVSWLVDQPSVTSVTLGKVVSATSQKFTRRAECKTTDTRIKALLVATTSAQALTIATRTKDDTDLIADSLARQWMKGRISLVGGS